MSFLDHERCSFDQDCKYLYLCIDELCQHKEFFPPTQIEFIGMILMGIFSGISSLAGIGGGGIMVSLFVAFFNYTQKLSVLIVFIPIFGAAFGNFLNLMSQVDPISKLPVVNVKLAILSFPMMAFGSLVGVILNKLFPSSVIVSFLLYFLQQSFFKFLRISRKDMSVENDRRTKLLDKLNQVKEIEMEIISRNSYQPYEEQDQQNKNTELKKIILMIIIITSTFIFLFFIRGSRELHSIINLNYCGLGYWIINILIALTCLIFFKINISLFLDMKYIRKFSIINRPAEVINFIRIQSFKAGILNGFGLGGGMFLVPLYSTLGLSSIQATGTSSFNIFMTSFLTMTQVIALGLIPVSEAIKLAIFMIFATYICSTFIFKILSKFDKLSLIMWSLVIFSLEAGIMLVIQFFRDWKKNDYDIMELVQFSEFC